MKLSRRTLLAAVAALLLVAAPSLVDRTPRGDVQPQVLAGEISYVSRDADAFQFTATAGDDDLGVLHRGRASFATGGAEIIDCTRGKECMHADRPTRGCLVPLTSGARAEIASCACTRRTARTTPSAGCAASRSRRPTTCPSEPLAR